MVKRKEKHHGKVGVGTMEEKYESVCILYVKQNQLPTFLQPQPYVQQQRCVKFYLYNNNLQSHTTPTLEK